MRHRIKYPKLLLLLITVIIAVILFYGGKNYTPFHDILISLSYLGTFFGGILYAYGFTAAPATAVLLVLAQDQNIVLAAVIGGFGALLSDLFIFNVVRYSFADEINRLEKERFVLYIKKKEKTLFGHYYNHIFPAFAGFLIASPLPTEIGITLMASMRSISLKKFILLAYLLHSLGILVILTIGNAL